MDVFLTGGTGYIGAAVASELTRAGHRVHALAHHDEALRVFTEAGYTPVPGGLRNRDVLAAAAEDADAVVHAGFGRGSDAADVDRAAVEAFLEVLVGTGRHLVYTSGIWVLGDTGERLADEDTPLDPAEIVAWRPAVERSVLEAAERGVASVVVRPAIVYGEGGGIPGDLAGQLRERGSVDVVGDGRQLWPFVHLQDLADLYVRLLEAPGGRLYHAADGPSCRAVDVALGLCHASGRREDCVRLRPLDAAREKLGPYADALALSQRISGGRAREELGWRPRAATLMEEILAGSYAARLRS